MARLRRPFQPPLLLLAGYLLLAATAPSVNELLQQGQALLQRAQFEEALHLFTQAQALTQKTSTSFRAARTDLGAVEHNIASCLHCLGHFEEAKVHYEQALSAFERYPPSRISVALYGDCDKRRCDFVRSRLVDIEHGRKPDLDKYLDGWGYEQNVTPDLAEPPRYNDDARIAASAFGGFGARRMRWGSPAACTPRARGDRRGSRAHTGLHGPR